MARRIKQAKISFISLVPRGANNIATIYKDDGTFAHELIVKGMNERGEVIAAVYTPERKDTQGDIASAEVIKDAAYNAAKTGFDIDIRHNNVPVSKDKAFVAETFIIQKGDPRFDDARDYNGNKVDVTHGWGIVIKVEDEDLRKQYREGKWQGVSMGGTALVEQLKEAPPAEDFNMTPAELEAALAKSNTALATSLATTIGEAIAKAMKPTAPAKTTEEIAKEATDKKNKERRAALLKGAGAGDSRAFKRAGLVMQKEQIAEAVDVNDETAFAEAVEKVAALDKQIGEIDAEIKAEKEAKGGETNPNQARIDVLEKELTQLRGRSQQPVNKSGNGNGATSGSFIGVEKGDGIDPDADFKMGSAMAQATNELHGYGKPKAA